MHDKRLGLEREVPATDRRGFVGEPQRQLGAAAVLDGAAGLREQIAERIAAGDRVLVTTLTKRLAEDLSSYLNEQGVACKWLHSELDAFERVELLRDLREGRFDVPVQWYASR